MDGLMPADLAGWIALASSIGAALWAILTFARNNRVKAAEILLAVEKEYANHIETLLQLELAQDYEEMYKQAIIKSVHTPMISQTEAESEAMNRLEKVLRYFFACANVRRLSVDAGAIDRLCAYYLRILVDRRRPELREYVQKFWPTVYYWALLAGRPWPKRLAISVKQMPARLKSWWTSAEPSLGLITREEPSSLKGGDNIEEGPGALVGLSEKA